MPVNINMSRLYMTVYVYSHYIYDCIYTYSHNIFLFRGMCRTVCMYKEKES